MVTHSLHGAGVTAVHHVLPRHRRFQGLVMKIHVPGILLCMLFIALLYRDVATLYFCSRPLPDIARIFGMRKRTRCSRRMSAAPGLRTQTDTAIVKAAQIWLCPSWAQDPPGLFARP